MGVSDLNGHADILFDLPRWNEFREQQGQLLVPSQMRASTKTRKTEYMNRTFFPFFHFSAFGCRYHSFLFAHDVFEPAKEGSDSVPYAREVLTYAAAVKSESDLPTSQGF